MYDVKVVAATRKAARVADLVHGHTDEVSPVNAVASVKDEDIVEIKIVAP